jgi:S-adenosyl-L-methionine hydrolase (adenosine-forming)
MHSMPIVTLTTDFGLQDHYVASMKGVILRIAPKATLVDVTHEIAAHNVLHAGLILDQIWDCFPAETIHLAVVDPGVGTERRILIGRYAGQILIAPDNGLVTLVHRRGHLEEMRVATNSRLFAPSPSATFHGRDIFAPLAGHLARGMKLAEVGPQTDHVQILQIPQPAFTKDHSLAGEVLYVDRFGTLITNIRRDDVTLAYNRRRNAEIHVGDARVGPLMSTFGQVAPGLPVAFIGSTNLLEVAVNQGSAARHFNAGPGTPVHIR